MDGVSVIVCCHNGATRLPATLAHLKVQKPPIAPWEVLLIDNASSDATAEVARSCWQNGPAPLRVVQEPCLGVRYARERGLAEAKYSFLGFVDDDNWVADDWVRSAYEIVSSDPALGAVGSIRTPVCEVSPPAWFANVHSSYAILTDHEFEQMREPPPYLPTAGLCLRRVAWDKLIQNGFHLQPIGSLGKEIVGGEDVELTRSLRLSGWKLRVDQRLRLLHFMPSHRLQWAYARRLLRDYGASDVLLDAYSEHSVSSPPGFRRWVSERWWYQMGACLRKIASQPGSVIAAVLSTDEGRNDVMEIEKQFGRALGLVRHTRRYGEVRREVRDAPWRKMQPYSGNRFEASSDRLSRSPEDFGDFCPK
jgi:glycosyltransferase involved in cell wall biosynthesis